MSDETNNPGEPPTNQGGGNAPQTDSEPTETQRSGETPVNQGGGS
jgi:hypothetical protein